MRRGSVHATPRQRVAAEQTRKEIDNGYRRNYQPLCKECDQLQDSLGRAVRDHHQQRIRDPRRSGNGYRGAHFKRAARKSRMHRGWRECAYSSQSRNRRHQQRPRSHQYVRPSWQPHHGHRRNQHLLWQRPHQSVRQRLRDRQEAPSIGAGHRQCSQGDGRSAQHRLRDEPRRPLRLPG